jgi:coenzyme F420-reducing hydrogenase beta subunit
MQKLTRELTNYFIGNNLGVFIASARKYEVRQRSASGGVATAILRYLLENKYVDAVIVPKPRFMKGFVYGIWTVTQNPKEIIEFAGSLYAPTFGFNKIFNYALKKFKRIAVSALPCYTKAIRKILELQGRSQDVFIVGLYCDNTPGIYATKYALKFFKIPVEEVVSLRFRDGRWPGHTVIQTKRGSFSISFPIFWNSGFGQYFHGVGCYLCTDHTNVLADISLADPWTLPYDLIEKIGGATLVITRTDKGLKIFKKAIEDKYIEAEEIDSIFAIQGTTLIKESKKVLRKCLCETKLSPSFVTITYELLNNIGRLLSSKESLWILLKIFHKFASPLAFSIAYYFDDKLKTRWAKINKYIMYSQKNKGYSVKKLLETRNSYFSWRVD